MKGPSGRYRFDLRRVWECPVCKQRKFTTGQVVHLASTCCGNGTVWMNLVEEEKTKPPGTDANKENPYYRRWK